MIKLFMLVSFILLFSFQVANAKHANPEKWYQEKYCPGQKEVTMDNGSRCDCLTATHAIEFDFAGKWAEAIGQALNYGFQTGKRPGVYLILEQPSDYKFWVRMNSVIQHFNLPIDAWKVGDGVGEK